MSESKTHRYLLFDTGYMEQFNKQLFTLLYFIEMARVNEVTLVIPRVKIPVPGYKPWTNSESYKLSQFDYLSFHDFLDLSNLDIPYITIDKYFQINGFHIDTVYLDYEIPFPYREIRGIHHGFFNGFPITVKNFIPQQGEFDLTNKDSPSIGFLGTIRAYYNSKHPTNIRNHKLLEYVPKFYDITSEIQNDWSSASPKEPLVYLAIHWRRTDFLSQRKQKHMNAIEFVNYCRMKMHEHNCSKIFLATDNKNKREMNFIIRHLPLLMYRTNSDRYDRAILDQLLCVGADAFYGTKTSCFTDIIIDRRHIIGKSSSLLPH